MGPIRQATYLCLQEASFHSFYSLLQQLVLSWMTCSFCGVPTLIDGSLVCHHFHLRCQPLGKVVHQATLQETVAPLSLCR